MRMALGLVSLLVVIAIMLFVFKFYSAPVLKEGKKTQDKARQIAGRDEDGNNATDSMTLEEQNAGGKMTGVLVTKVAPGGAMEKHFGFLEGDVIVQVGPLTVKDNFTSAGEAKDYLLDAFQRNSNVIVMRGWDRVTLPAANAPVAAAEGPQSTEQRTPKKRAPGQESSGNSLQRQLDLIQKGQGRGDEQGQ